MNETLDVEREFDDTIARLRRDLPQLVGADEVTGTRPSLDDVLSGRAAVPVVDELAGRRGRRSGSQRWWLAAAAAVVAVTVGMAIWHGQGSPIEPIEAAAPGELPTYEVLPGEIVVNEDPLIVVLADPAPDAADLGDGHQAIEPALDLVDDAQVRRLTEELDQLVRRGGETGGTEALEWTTKITVLGLVPSHGLVWRFELASQGLDGTVELGAGYGHPNGMSFSVDSARQDRSWFVPTASASWGDPEGVFTYAQEWSGLGEDATGLRLRLEDRSVSTDVIDGWALLYAEGPFDGPLVAELLEGEQVVRSLVRTPAELGLVDVEYRAELDDQLWQEAQNARAFLDALDDDPGLLPSSTLTVFGADWCPHCDSLSGLEAAIEAASVAAPIDGLTIQAVPFQSDDWPTAEMAWSFEVGGRNGVLEELVPAVPWVVVTDAEGRPVYSGTDPSAEALTLAFEILADE